MSKTVRKTGATKTKRRTAAKKATTRKTTARKTAAAKTAVKKTTTAAKPAVKKTVKRTVAQTKRVASNTAVKPMVLAKAVPAATNEAFQAHTDVVKDFISTSTKEAQKVQDSLFATSRDGAEQMARSADVATRSFNEVFGATKDSVDTAMQCSNIAGELSRDLGSELFNYANAAFSQNVELSKEYLNCRTLHDMVDLNNKIVQTNIDQFFNESLKVSEMIFNRTNEATEPLSERLNETTDRLSKAFAA